MFQLFLNTHNFFNLNSNCSNLLDMRNLQKQSKMYSVTKNCSELSHFEKLFQSSQFSNILQKKFSITRTIFSHSARTYLQLPLRQWGADNVYLLVLSSWKVNIAKNPIVVMGL